MQWSIVYALHSFGYLHKANLKNVNKLLMQTHNYMGLDLLQSEVIKNEYLNVVYHSELGVETYRKYV